MNARGILAGTKVELELFNDMDKKIGTTYAGEFMEIAGDMDVTIFSPGHASMPLSFSKKIWVRANFFHAIHGPLNFTGILTRKEATKNGIKFYIRIDDDFKKIQKREYFRPDCFLKTEYRILKNATDNKETKIPYKRTVTINISFRGLCILLNENDTVAEDDLVDLVVWLRDDISIHIQSKVVRIMEYGEKQYRIGLSTEYISKNDSAILTKFITRNIMDKSLFLGETPFNF